jgi:hypothetical protein
MNDEFILIEFQNFDFPSNNIYNIYHYNINISKIILLQKIIKKWLKNKESDYCIIDIYSHNNLIKNTNLYCKRYIDINLKDYFKNLCGSFKDIYDIKDQFLKDFYRQKFIINNHIIKDHNNFLDYFDYKIKNKEINKKILMMSTQACMGTPFEILFNIFNTDNKFIIDNKEDNNKFKNFLVLNFTYNNYLCLKIFKKFQIIKIINGDKQIIYCVNTKIDYNFNLDDSIKMEISLFEY